MQVPAEPDGDEHVAEEGEAVADAGQGTDLDACEGEDVLVCEQVDGDR